jgi:hypothetical protein
MVIIDQKESENYPYLLALRSLKSSPFEYVDLLLGSEKGSSKYALRQKNFKLLDQILEEYPVDTVYVGSDRRIEFQYVMQRLKGKAEGGYLDDGLYSYAGRPHIWFKDKVNSVIKKIVYGRWWDEPLTIGSSHWIEKAWLFEPRLAHPLLKEKAQEKIPAIWFKANAIQEFSERMLQHYSVKVEFLKKVDVVLIISHPNNQKKMKGYGDRVQRLIDELIRNDLKIAVKYHPRESDVDPLNLVKSECVMLLPSTMAFELVLPALKSGAWVVGDVGTTSLTSRWLRDDVGSMAVLSKNDKFEKYFAEILEPHGVTVVDSFQSAISILKNFGFIND